MHDYSDYTILSELRQNRGGSINYLYEKYFPLARSFVLKNSGTYEDAEDVFQDGLIALFKKVLIEPFATELQFEDLLFLHLQEYLDAAP